MQGSPLPDGRTPRSPRHSAPHEVLPLPQASALHMKTTARFLQQQGSTVQNPARIHVPPRACEGAESVRPDVEEGVAHVVEGTSSCSYISK